MSTSAQDEQAERHRVFAQDQSLRNQGSTFHQHAQADAETPRGRFSAVSNAYVVGSKPDVASAYPAASSAHQTELPPEPPTGYAIDAMPELDPGPPLAQTLPNPASAPTGDVEPAGLGLSSGDLTSDAPSTLPLVDAQRGGRSLPIGDPAPASFPPGPARNRVVRSPPSRLRRF